MFPGVLNYFARSLRGDEVGSRQMDILKSLSDIIRLMGSENISLVKCTILSTLKTGLEVSGVSLKALVQIWDSFVRTIDVNSLRPILGLFTKTLKIFLNERKQLGNHFQSGPKFSISKHIFFLDI